MTRPPADPSLVVTVTVDPDRLRDNLLRLAEIRIHLLTGAPFEHAGDWPGALADVLAVLGTMTPPPRLVARRCLCGGTLERTTAIVEYRERRVIACTACEFIEVTK